MGRWWRCGGGVGLLAGLNTRKGQTYFLIIMNLPRLSHAGAWEPGGKVSPLLSLPPLEGPSPIKHPRVCQPSAVLAPSWNFSCSSHPYSSHLTRSSSSLLPPSHPSLLLLSLLLLLSISTFLSLAYLTSNLLPTHPPFPSFCLIVILPGSAD